jgi:hypothetical protein
MLCGGSANHERDENIKDLSALSGTAGRLLGETQEE